MTFQESTKAIRKAAESQDLAALETAAKHRDALIASIQPDSATPELCEAVSESLAAGEQARVALSLIKQRIRGESRRLAGIEQGFLRTMRGEDRRHIDCKG